MNVTPDEPINGSHYLTLKRFAIAQLVLLLLIGAAFYATILAIQHQRERAARNTCYLLRSLVLATPRGHTATATAYLNATALRDCDAYGRGVVSPPKRGV